MDNPANHANRAYLRKNSAAYLNSLSLDELFRSFNITRIARLDGLDAIGVPVYSGIRPAGKVISVSAGKSTNRALARAGAIAESIEYHVFENPSGEFEVGTLGSELTQCYRGTMFRGKHEIQKGREVWPVRPAESIESQLVQKLQGVIHEGMEENSSLKPGSETQKQLPIIRQGIPEKGKLNSPTLRDLRIYAESNASRGLQQTSGYYLDVQTSPFSTSLLPLSKDSEWTPETPICLEPVKHLVTGKDCLFPSSLVWLENRGTENVQYFQKSSNGQAVGATLEDALLQGLLECVERDQVTLRRISLKELGIYPPRSDVPSSCEEIELLCNRASLKLFLFLCNVDIPIPVYWAILCDPDWQAFAGWGCSLDPGEAAVRAILEAIQSRVVYIAGARDDIQRRYVDRSEQKSLIERLSGIPKAKTNYRNSYRHQNVSVETELSTVLSRLGPWVDRIYYKHIQICEHLCAVKVQVLGFEQPVLPDMYGWQPVRWHKLKEQYEDFIRTT